MKDTRDCPNCIFHDLTCMRWECKEITRDEAENAVDTLRNFDWIPVKFRPLTEQEQKEHPDYCYMADCLMPDDGQEILVTTTFGTVEKDEAGIDEGFYLDSGYDWQTDIVAWMPLPEPYKKEQEHEQVNHE